LFSSFLVAASIISPIEGVIENLPPEPLLRLRAAVSHVAQALIPASNTSVKELDQAVAIIAGASVLGFSIYDVANACYNSWNIGINARPQSEEVEFMLTQIRNGSH